ncbi:putative phosphatidylinositol 4-kinase [Diaporthe ampelina]|uniref:1-phosphatidylinositol 4-kinase n=1 Tax=Diaporthe ampelina TaxID=1214573 RepID=A0A0G2FS23_9PEZI|nr:putative phosphatidylinositol 4-kinase [Diaporthe ampelina]
MQTASIAVSLLGFLDAAAAQADFWRSGGRLALIQRLQRLLNERFLIAVETAFSKIRNSHSHDRAPKEWRRYLRHYQEVRRPLGAMLLQQRFMLLVTSSTSLLVAENSALKKTHVLDLLMAGEGLLRPGTGRSGNGDTSSVVTYSNIVIDQLNYLEASADFIRMGSSSQQKIACAVKAAAFISYLNCSRLNEDAADTDTLMAWLEDTIIDPDQMADEDLASVVIRSMAIVCRMSPTHGASVSRLLPRFIVQGRAPSHVVVTASQCLAYVLRMLSTDAVITTLYTLGNVLSPTTEENDKAEFGLENSDSQVYRGRQSTGSSISLQFIGEEETSTVYINVIDAICGIATACNDEKISALAQSILLQKYDRISNVVDARVITGAAVLSLSAGQLEFRSLLKSFARIAHAAVVDNRVIILHALTSARNHISANLHRDSQLYDIYWDHMLDSIVSKGDVSQTSHAKESDMELAAKEIAELLQPLAVFMSANDMAANNWSDDEFHAMLRDAWFNIVVHGFNPVTERGKRYADDLRVIAIHSPPLVAEQRGEQVESDIELNTVLRRGMSSDRESQQKKHLAELVSSKASDIKGLSYRKVIFLHTAYLVESLRAESGDCTKVLSYFLEPSMRKGDVSSVMEGITGVVVEKYLRKTLGGVNNTFSAQYAASQLATIFCNCCHRIERVQQAAYACADRIIRDVPSALCRRSSLFALLELLSLMWASCLEAETEMYEPRSTFTSERGNVTVELSDDYTFRKFTLNRLYKAARGWVSTAINLSPADVKGLLQTHLSEFDDEGAYGHVSLGRSFAMELGSAIPATDQRLISIDGMGEANINTASDFIAQYTTRQEYRYAEALPDHSLEWLTFMRIDRRASYLSGADTESADAVTALAHIENRILQKRNTPMVDVRDILRRAAALLCRSESGAECAVAHHLVSIPFAMFTKQAIKLGISLWLGVMNENPIWEPRILNEISQQWELSIHKKLGLFNVINAVKAVGFIGAHSVAYQNHPFLIQYAMRALESHSVDVTFFYVPQIVQTLRYDALGYVERYIIETAQFSQLFAHQIIWNMKANSYKDDDGQVPDDIKPTLDKVMERMVDSFDPTDREFYEREFTFFDEVTGISGKLKPLIKKSKPEKAQKIEEELRNIKVEVGVYLPSNPDGVVIGIDRKSGKPLQSHAKAPFMATFRIKKDKGSLEETGSMMEEAVERGTAPAPTEQSIEVWQSAIFKVGDDCRQDVLALQMIAAFRGIFHSVGLDVYVFPYRVTATAPGCGVIDVLPNSVSRDMLGREAVNGLYDYFISKYGNEDSLRFQQARNNFVKSMAAYSLISFLLQFKDRHNGNIMIDDAGHILHIDFGFCFDIAPGGIKFERAPFKLTSEMVAVMGGSTNHQSFKWFEELIVKSFLASRTHVEKLSQIVLLMMDSGLPCFKPESVEHFKQRFVLDKTDREAADFMKELVRKSYSSYSTGIYDQFQLMTNGIPY